MERKSTGIPFWVWYFLVISPFMAGGFHTYMSAIAAAVLVFALLKRVEKEKKLRIVVNLNVIMIGIMVTAYCVTPLWAADKGMSVFGITRYLPLLILAILLMQDAKEKIARYLALLPGSGAAMILISCVLWCIPGTSALVVVNGRLSGFLQYPNTFAAFLLTGLAVLGTKQNRRLSDVLLIVILIAGIFLSGSRTAFLLLLLLPLIIAVVHKKVSPFIPILLVIVFSTVVFFLIRSGSQISILGRDIGSLLVRILYYKDALPVILRHPFGLGYMGYRALETTFQTSRYTVSFVHSGLLQMLLDIGWIPAMMCLTVIVKTLMSSHTSATAKSVLLILSAHALFDFDLQFFLFWIILLLCLDFENGRVYQWEQGRVVCYAISIGVLAVCTWMGLGDWFYQTGNNELSLKITPFHTDAMVSSMKTIRDPEDLDIMADRILSMNPTHALAYSAKANAAYSRGQVPEMIRYKETAIRLTPYTIEEYCDYIQKLYHVLEIYARNGDEESAGYCVKKILSIPSVMADVAAGTDPLSHKTGNNSDVILPEEYQQLLAELEKIHFD